VRLPFEKSNIAHRIVIAEARQRHMRMAIDDREQAVEVVGHSSGQPSDGFHIVPDEAAPPTAILAKPGNSPPP
jgi:hypothetical protein